MRKKILLVLFIVFTINAFSQSHLHPGYIINKDGEIIDGYIEYKGDIEGALYCLFKQNENEKAQKYLPQDLKEYGITGEKTFESKNINDTVGLNGQYFVEVLVKGKLSLYSIQNKKTKKRDCYLVTEDDEFHLLYETREEKIVMVQRPGEPAPTETKAMVTLKVYIGTLKYFMNNCQQINGSIDKVKLKIPELIELFKKYNTCRKEEFEVKTNEGAYKFKTSMGFMIGGGKTLFAEDFYLLRGGLFFSFYKPRMDNKAGANIGFYYNYHEEYHDGWAEQYYYAIHTLDIPFTVVMKFNQRKIQPYLGLGIDIRLNYYTDSKSVEPMLIPLVIDTGINQYLRNKHYIKYNLGLTGNYLSFGIGYGF